MAIEKVREHLKKWGKDKDIMELTESCATVDLAAMAIGCEPSRIAKTLSFNVSGGCVLVVSAGDTRVDNAKYKEFFGTKAKMLTPDEVIEFVGHAVGGVCPFGIKDGVRVYLDISLKRFDTVYPACGSSNSVIKLTLDELYEYSGAIDFVDVCKGWE